MHRLNRDNISNTKKSVTMLRSILKPDLEAFNFRLDRKSRLANSTHYSQSNLIHMEFQLCILEELISVHNLWEYLGGGVVKKVQD